MPFATGIKLNGVNFNNPNLPTHIDYQALIAENAACVGFWRFDIDSLVTEDGGGVSSIANWKSGGAALAYVVGTKATRVVNAFGRKNLNFAASGAYNIGADTFDAIGSYTVVASFKPDSYATQGHVAGAYGGSSATSAGIRKLQSAGSNPILRHVRGDKSAGSATLVAADYQVAFASHTAGDTSPFLSVNGNVTTTAGAAEVIVAAQTFQVSHNSLSFTGDIDFVALFNTDLINTDTTLGGYVSDFAAARLL